MTGRVVLGVKNAVRLMLAVKMFCGEAKVRLSTKQSCRLLFVVFFVKKTVFVTIPYCGVGKLLLLCAKCDVLLR